MPKKVKTLDDVSIAVHVKAIEERMFIGIDVQSEENERLVGFFKAAGDTGRGIEETQTLAVVLRGENKGRQPAEKIMLVCAAFWWDMGNYTGRRR